ncbi:unnamed protein product [Effrenium voratum]|nr:unnamed protein product [Effrenium voratum]
MMSRELARLKLETFALLLCTEPVAGCLMLRRLSVQQGRPLPMLGYFGVALLNGCPPQDVPTFWQNFGELFVPNARVRLATNNLILSEQIFYQSGQRLPYVRAHGLYTEVFYTPQLLNQGQCAPAPPPRVTLEPPKSAAQAARQAAAPEPRERLLRRGTRRGTRSLEVEEPDLQITSRTPTPTPPPQPLTEERACEPERRPEPTTPSLASRTSRPRPAPKCEPERRPEDLQELRIGHAPTPSTPPAGSRTFRQGLKRQLAKEFEPMRELVRGNTLSREALSTFEPFEPSFPASTEHSASPSESPMSRVYTRTQSIENVPDAPPVRDCSPLSGEHDERKDELQDELQELNLEDELEDEFSHEPYTESGELSAELTKVSSGPEETAARRNNSAASLNRSHSPHEQEAREDRSDKLKMMAAKAFAGATPSLWKEPPAEGESSEDKPRRSCSVKSELGLSRSPKRRTSKGAESPNSWNRQVSAPAGAGAGAGSPERPRRSSSSKSDALSPSRGGSRRGSRSLGRSPSGSPESPEERRRRRQQRLKARLAATKRSAPRRVGGKVSFLRKAWSHARYALLGLAEPQVPSDEDPRAPGLRGWDAARALCIGTGQALNNSKRLMRVVRQAAEEAYHRHCLQKAIVEEIGTMLRGSMASVTQEMDESIANILFEITKLQMVDMAEVGALLCEAVLNPDDNTATHPTSLRILRDELLLHIQSSPNPEEMLGMDEEHIERLVDEIMWQVEELQCQLKESAKLSLGQTHTSKLRHMTSRLSGVGILDDTPERRESRVSPEPAAPLGSHPPPVQKQKTLPLPAFVGNKPMSHGSLSEIISLGSRMSSAASTAAVSGCGEQAEERGRTHSRASERSASRRSRETVNWPETWGYVEVSKRSVLYAAMAAFPRMKQLPAVVATNPGPRRELSPSGRVLPSLVLPRPLSPASRRLLSDSVSASVPDANVSQLGVA